MAKIFGWFKKSKKRLKGWFWVIVVVLVLVAGFFFVKGRSKKELISSTVGKGIVMEELILTGSVKGEKHSLLSFPASGKISWVGVTEGQKVVKGQALISLDKTVLNATYQQALNYYKDKQASAEKAEDDVKNHSSDETLTQKATRTTAQVARDSAWDSMLAAKYNLDNATIVAPFAGIVSSLPFSSPGVNVSLTDTMVEIIDPATLYFDVDADQNDVTSITLGQKVIMVLDSYSDKEISGKVIFVAFTPKSGATGTNYKVKVMFDEGAFLEIAPRVGMTGDAKFVLSQKDDVIYVPSEFVKSDIKGKYIKVGSVKNKTYVETGLESEERVEIVGSGLNEGDIVYD
jgi:RND family efflux transporter MFP subunit